MLLLAVQTPKLRSTVNTQELERKMTFDYDETRSKLENHFLGDFLLKIWDDHIDSGRTKRTIWDLSIINAFLHPERMEEVEIMTSKDNGNRKIYYYKELPLYSFSNKRILYRYKSIQMAYKRRHLRIR